MSHQVAPPSTPYGPAIDIAGAKKAMAAAEAEAGKNGWAVAIAIVDSGGNLVMLQRLDNAQLSSVRIAQQKARTAVEFRRPTKIFEDAVAGGKIIGAIGVSGVQSHQDGQIAQAGADALK